MTPMTITVAECCVYRASRAFEGAEAYHGFDSRPRLSSFTGVAGLELVLERIEEAREQLAEAKRARGGSGVSVTNERHGTRPKPKSGSLDRSK